MSPARRFTAAAWALALVASMQPARGDAVAVPAEAAGAADRDAAPLGEPDPMRDGQEVASEGGTPGGQLIHLNPALAEDAWGIAPGPKAYAHRLSFSPAYGALGAHELYAFRFAYNPNEWLGWEAGVAHNPGESVHALLHTFSAVLRYPFPWRVQPYATGGYGMLMVFPGGSINADPVTSNALVAGGGLELYVRDDVAIRAELKQATVFGGVKGGDETVAYGYREASIGFAFYRTLGGGGAAR